MVSCGDCKHFHPFATDDDRGMCYLKDDDIEEVWTSADAFCSAGVRKEDPDEEKDRVSSV